jgi:periplasmic protein CpxP/Spy
MKTLTKVWLMLIAILLVHNLNAQPPRLDPEEWAKKETEMAKEQIALTDSQTVYYESIAFRYAKMSEELHSIPRDSMELFRKKMDGLQEKKKAEIKQILSEEQFVKYEKWMEENRNRMKKGNKGGGGPPPNQ